MSDDLINEATPPYRCPVCKAESPDRGDGIPYCCNGLMSEVQQPMPPVHDPAECEGIVYQLGLRMAAAERERDELRAFVVHNWGTYVLTEFDRNRRV